MQKMVWLALTVGGMLVGSGSLAVADDHGNNREICDREYKSEPVERAVCNQLGERSPGIRDCLIRERERTGARGDRDTVRDFVDRHGKCWKEALTGPKEPRGPKGGL